MMNKNEAIQAANAGAVLACISGIATAAFTSYAIYSNADGVLGVWNDPATFGDVFIIFICAYAIYRKSRTAAVFMFLYFILSKAYIALESGRPPAIVVSLVFLYFFGKAIKGTFVYHKIERETNPSYKQTSKWIVIPGALAILLLFVAMGYGLMSIVGVIPSTEVIPGSKVREKDRELLVLKTIIDGDEKIEHLYSDGFTSVLEGGHILTDKRLISYITDENGELNIYELHFDDIASINLIEQGDFLNPSIYQINSFREDAWLTLYLPTERKGDLKFIESLKEKLGNKPSMGKD